MLKKINKSLNLVVELQREDGGVVYAHSAPVARDVFEQFYRVIAKTFAQIYQDGIGLTSGPRVAALVLRDVAKEIGVEDVVRDGLVAEMHRLTNVLTCGPGGWDTVPYVEAVRRELITDDEAAEVDNAVTFFTVLWHMHHRTLALRILPGMLKLWGGRLELLNSTELLNSLRKLMAAENSGAKVA